MLWVGSNTHTGRPWGSVSHTVRGDTMDTAFVTTLEPKRRAESPILAAYELVSDGPVDYVGRHVRATETLDSRVWRSHPRGQGFRILTRLAQQPA